MKITTKAEECNCDQALELKVLVEELVDLMFAVGDGYYLHGIDTTLKEMGIEDYE